MNIQNCGIKTAYCKNEIYSNIKLYKINTFDNKLKAVIVNNSLTLHSKGYFTANFLSLLPIITLFWDFKQSLTLELRI